MNQHKIVIIGAGFSGICMGIKLKAAGYSDFVILEKAKALGGTWRENTYPGAECDIPSALYSYSFEHNDKWQYIWSAQKQILKYQNDTAEKYGLLQHMRFQQALVSANFDHEAKLWTLETATGEQYQAQHLVTGVGQLHHPSTPSFTNQETYKGESFHTANWNHDVDLKNKRVAVIGSAATAVQFVPEIAKEVAQLTIYQRSPNWILPKPDRAYSKFEQWLSGKVPSITKLYRLNIWIKGEFGIMPAIRGNRLARWWLRLQNRKLLKESITDAETVAKLTPDYPMGAKRILFANDYYAAIAKDNVQLESQAIQSFTANGIVAEDGVERAADVVIYSTGFNTNPFLAEIELRGLNNELLADKWATGAYAYLGVSTAGFPNLHMMYGPNTNLGHNSIIIMIEAQAKYIVQCIAGLDSRDQSALEINSNVESNYNIELQERLSKLAFAEVEQSWYKDGDRITNNWAGGTAEYMRRMKEVDWQAYGLS